MWACWKMLYRTCVIRKMSCRQCMGIVDGIAVYAEERATLAYNHLIYDYTIRTHHWRKENRGHINQQNLTPPLLPKLNDREERGRDNDTVYLALDTVRFKSRKISQSISDINYTHHHPASVFHSFQASSSLFLTDPAGGIRGREENPKAKRAVQLSYRKVR